MTESEFEGWAIVELMGHRKLAGHCTAVDLFGAAMLRIDVYGPKTDGDDRPRCTQYYNGTVIYCLTPTTEELARRVAVACAPAPVTRWELPPPNAECQADPACNAYLETDAE